MLCTGDERDTRGGSLVGSNSLYGSNLNPSPQNATQVSVDSLLTLLTHHHPGPEIPETDPGWNTGGSSDRLQAKAVPSH